MELEHPYNIWASVSLFGHRTVRGYVTLYQTYGEQPDVCWIKVDVPNKDGGKDSHFYSPNAVYMIEPEEESAIRDYLFPNINTDELPF